MENITHTFQLTEEETKRLEKIAKESRRSKASQIAFYVMSGVKADEESGNSGQDGHFCTGNPPY